MTSDTKAVFVPKISSGPAYGALTVPLVGTAGVVPPEVTHVDLSAFRHPRAKIDVIKIIVSPKDLELAAFREVEAVIPPGRLRRNPRQDYACTNDQPWIAVHDPKPADLRYLVERFWRCKIAYIEFAVDFRLPEGANNLDQLEVLKAQLRHCMMPQRHDRLRGASRKIYVPESRRYRPDGLGTEMIGGQIIYERADICDQVGLYVKEKDGGRTVQQPWVRVEARLEATGPFAAGIERVGMLPAFGARLRSYLAPAFWIADGFKQPSGGAARRQYEWDAWGAQYAVGKGIAVRPNAHANRLVGQALKDLGRMLDRLPSPTPVGGSYAAWVADDWVGWSDAA